MGEHGSCAVGGVVQGGSLCKFQMKFAQRGGTTRMLYNGGGSGGGHCARSKMPYNDVRISNEICAVGGA